MTSDHHINGDSVLHDYEYEQDSDLDDEEDSEDDPDDIVLQHNIAPGGFPTGSSSQMHTPSKLLFLPVFRLEQTVLPAGSTQGGIHGMEDELPGEPPAYSVSNCRMMLVKGVAYKT